MFSEALLQVQFSNNSYKGLNVDDINFCNNVISVLLLASRKVESLHLLLMLSCLGVHWLH